jgi:hypothetical protein
MSETTYTWAIANLDRNTSDGKVIENSIVQLLLNAVNSLKPFRTEDDKIAKVKDSILK